MPFDFRHLHYDRVRAARHAIFTRAVSRRDACLLDPVFALHLALGSEQQTKESAS